MRNPCFKTLVLGFGLCMTSQPAFPGPAQELAVVDVVFADQELAKCVQKYSAEQGYRTVAEVKEIPCFNLGIHSLAGLELFSEALVIDVSVNDISDFSPLYELGAGLGYLDIHGNHIACSILPLLSRYLPHAFLVGLDPRTCELDRPAPTPPAPTPPAPTPPAPTPSAPTPPAPTSSTPTPPAPTPSAPTPPAPPVDPLPAPGFAEVVEIVSSHCGSCHMNGRHKGGVRLDSEEDMLGNRSRVLGSIRRGRMPPRGYGFASSLEGQKLMTYLGSLTTRTPGGESPNGDCRGGHGHEEDFGDHRHGCHEGDDDLLAL